MLCTLELTSRKYQTKTSRPSSSQTSRKTERPSMRRYEGYTSALDTLRQAPQQDLTNGFV